MLVKIPITKATVKMLYRDCKVSPSTVLVRSVTTVSFLEATPVNNAVIFHVMHAETFQIIAVARSVCASLKSSIKITMIWNF